MWLFCICYWSKCITFFVCVFFVHKMIANMTAKVHEMREHIAGIWIQWLGIHFVCMNFIVLPLAPLTICLNSSLRFFFFFLFFHLILHHSSRDVCGEASLSSQFIYILKLRKWSYLSPHAHTKDKHQKNNNNIRKKSANLWSEWEDSHRFIGAHSRTHLVRALARNVHIKKFLCMI